MYSQKTRKCLVLDREKFRKLPTTGSNQREWILHVQCYERDVFKNEDREIEGRCSKPHFRHVYNFISTLEDPVLKTKVLTYFSSKTETCSQNEKMKCNLFHQM
jgi:hypothetical protein